MASYTIPEEVIGVPLFVPTGYDYFEVTTGGMPNGDDCLTVRGDLSANYKAFQVAPVMSPYDICHKGEMALQSVLNATGKGWAMTCWLKLTNLGAAVTNKVMLGCSNLQCSTTGMQDQNAGNDDMPFMMSTESTANLFFKRHPTNNVSSPEGPKHLVNGSSVSAFSGNWFLVTINMTRDATPQLVLETFYNKATTPANSDTASWTGSGRTFGTTQYLHIGAYATAHAARADSWKIGKWAFHDHPLNLTERSLLYDAMVP